MNTPYKESAFVFPKKDHFLYQVELKFDFHKKGIETFYCSDKIVTKYFYFILCEEHNRNAENLAERIKEELFSAKVPTYISRENYEFSILNQLKKHFTSKEMDSKITRYVNLEDLFKKRFWDIK